MPTETAEPGVGRMASTGVEAASSSMEITVSKADLLRELTATQGVVERKTTIPILSNFLFEAAGDKLLITATNLDLGLRTSCPAKVKKEGSCTIPARQLSAAACISDRRRDQTSFDDPSHPDCKNNLRYLQRRVALHAQWRAYGA